MKVEEEIKKMAERFSAIGNSKWVMGFKEVLDNVSETMNHFKLKPKESDSSDKCPHGGEWEDCPDCRH